MKNLLSFSTPFDETYKKVQKMMTNWLIDKFRCPDFDYPGMPTVDYLRLKVPGPGVYKLKWGNEQVW